MVTQLTGTLVRVQNIAGSLTKEQILEGSIRFSQTIPAEVIMELAAANDGKQGEQLINLSIPGINVEDIQVFELPLLNSITKFQIGKWIVTLVAKTHTSPPTTIDFELLDDDQADNPQDLFISPKGGSKSISQSIGHVIPSSPTGDPLAIEEGLVYRGFASNRTYSTKGTSGSIGLAIRVTGGEDIDYDFIVQATGISLRS